MSTEQVGPLMRIIVSILSVAFVSWAGVVWKASDNLSDKFDSMMREFMTYTIKTEHRITALESETEKLSFIIRILKEHQEDHSSADHGKRNG